MNLDAVNGMDCAAFVAALGHVYENSPWVAERVWGARPFAGMAALHSAMAGAVASAPAERQLALLRAHPELAGREARLGELTDASVAEQSSAGLDRLSAAEVARIGELNAAYGARFGHPFIIAVRRHDKNGIFREFERRLANSPGEERAAALAEVHEITRLRLLPLFACAAGKAPG